MFDTVAELLNRVVFINPASSSCIKIINGILNLYFLANKYKYHKIIMQTTIAIKNV